MSTVIISKIEDMSKDFVPQDFRTTDEDFYLICNRQSNGTKYRALHAKEIAVLISNNNTAENWEKVQVSNQFDAGLVRNCEFWGLVRLGDLTHSYLEYHKLRLPVGLNHCTIISCDIGDNVSLRNVRYLSHYIIGNHCILFNINEMFTVENSKFGNGVIKDGEDEKVRIWLEAANENGGRSILPFVDMLPADAYLWTRYRDDEKLMLRFKELTDQIVDKRRGYYGVVGDRAVIKNSLLIKDVNIGSDCYIKGANKLKNLTIQSSKDEPTQIGEGVELVNGIVGHNNHIFYGVKAVRFVTGRNVQLKYGARLLNSYLGANSTISCCEVLNNLIFPFHEQHHNNSFLIASTIMGQSNIAAGATIGSNHNSRAADGEVIAGRGFWPGLMSNFKHNSVFAAFCLIAKGSYYSELNIPLPFALVSPTNDIDTIQIFPGFWFKYNMYALARNAWKFKDRDKRVIKDQNIEYDFLAPDTVEDMFKGIKLLQEAIEQAYRITPDKNLPENADAIDSNLTVYLDKAINKGRALVIKPMQGIGLYRMMISYYGARELLAAVKEAISAGVPQNKWPEHLRTGYREVPRSWLNIGGQLIPENSVLQILDDVKNDKIFSWSSLHERYNHLWQEYPAIRRNHGILSALIIRSKSIDDLTLDLIKEILSDSQQIARQIYDWAYDSREKDYSNYFRKATYRNDKEMEAVLGKLEDNSFLRNLKISTDHYIAEIDEILIRPV